ncbi:neutral zinc metallopeptidase [Aurantimonas sp. VKM B-3413]|uniref:KPN_02809 family neutral zinc metallopeptidase n=1 Tax=Aurantimonas sp. VKM B-3413 TaxID=2779401 RepID=UPI001E6536FC|nr:neutral zinc metallopeptidase [Aurantimonas sp. VKM B-3413]MCB8838776.1 zinc metallopeptidase [Aurantimonas sp. VKM B-3413]
MEWRGRRQSNNVEYSSGSGGSRGGGMRIPIRAGGGGIGVIVIALVLWLVFGVNPLQLLGMVDTGDYQTTQSQTTTRPKGARSETEQFVATVLADTEDAWGKRFQTAGESYAKPTLVFFDGRVGSACGSASAAMGPFYCPNDQKVYLDTSFFDQLRQQLNAPGDFAEAYVVAHEVGHHVQNLLGILPRYHEAIRGMSRADANALSVRIELQADCFAGIFAHDESSAGYLQSGDIGEATNAAEQIGDDTLQRRGQGTVVPDSFTHGTSAQRQQWFEAGYRSGDVEACDTLKGAI